MDVQYITDTHILTNIRIDMYAIYGISLVLSDYTIRYKTVYV